jgi:hypothetical protein
MSSTWRERFRPLVARILRETADLPELERARVRRQRFRDEYPALQSMGWAYKSWRTEINAQTGRLRPRSSASSRKAEPAGQLSFDALEGDAP